jgi:hexosaminidase
MAVSPAQRKDGSMSHPVIPAPLRFEAGGEREFAFRAGTTVAYADGGVAPMAERFCAQVTRRTGMRLVPRAGRPVPDEPSVWIELAAERELLPGYGHHTVWLDPELPPTFELIEQVLASMAEIFPGRYLHVGGDEPRGMPDDLYVSYIERLRRLVRSLGRRPLGWQETARAGLGPDDVIQYWLTGIGLPASVPPRVRAQMDAELAMSRRDVEAAAAASVPVIVSPLAHCYLDVPYAEPAADPAQADRQGRLGLRLYAPQTVVESFDWEPGETLGPGRDAQVAGVEAALWAETITGFDDLSFLLLPRLAGVAHQAWSAPHLAGWAGHRDRLARHGRLWAQDGLTYFRSSAVDWR